MPQIVEIPGVGEAEFPDEYSQEQIAGILRERFPSQPEDTGTGRIRSAASTLAQAVESGIGTGLQGFANIPRQISAAMTGGDAEAVQVERNTIVDSLARLSDREQRGLLTPELASARNELTKRLEFLEAQSESGPVTEAIYDAGTAIRQDAATRFQPNPKYREEFLAGTVPAVAGSAVQSVVPFVVSPGAGVANMLGQVFQDTYEENLEKGVSAEESARRALLNGIVSGGLESVSGGVVASIAKRLGNTSVRELAPLALRGIVQGAATEFLTGASQEAASQVISEKPIDPAEMAKQGGLEALGSLFITGPAVGVGAIADRIRRDTQANEVPTPQTSTEALAQQSLGLQPTLPDAVQIQGPEGQVLRPQETGQGEGVELPGVAAQDNQAAAQAQAIANEIAQLNSRVDGLFNRRKATEDPDERTRLWNEAQEVQRRINELEGRMGPGAANVDEMNRQRFVFGGDVLAGLQAAQDEPVTREQWERNFLVQYPELEGDTAALDQAWTASQRAAQQFEANEGQQPMPAVVSQQMGQPVGEGSTSIRNRTIDEENRRRGLAPTMEAARRAHPVVWDEAMREMDANPQAQSDLIARLRANPAETVSDTESAMLLHRRIELENEFDAATDRVNRTNEPVLKEGARQNQRKIAEQLDELTRIGRSAGTAAGRSLAARRMEARRDYTLARMVAEAQAAKGEPLTEKEMDVVEKQFDGIQRTQRELEARTEQLDEEASQEAADQATKELKEEAKKLPDPDPLVKSISERIIDYLDKRAAAARKRLRAKIWKVGSNPDYTIIVDLADLAASSIGKGVVNFSKWAGDMVTEFGEAVREYLEPAWKLANDNIDTQVAKVADAAKRPAVNRRVRKLEGADLRTALVGSMQQRMNDGESVDDLRAYVRRIALSFVQGGINEREALVKAVQSELEPLIPGITERQSADLISGYGDFRPLDKDAAKVKLRELSGEMQQVSKLEDIQARKAPLKTGVERRTPSDKERRLIREVNEAKKKYGVVTTDPARQLKGALDGVKSRLRNQIRDLTTQIDTGVKPPEKTQLQYDEEILWLQGIRDRLRQTLADVEGRPEVSEEQRIAAATRSLEASIAEYDRRIKSGDTGPRAKRPRISTPELEALRARRDNLRDELDLLRSANDLLIEERRAQAVLRDIERLEASLASGDVSPQVRQQTADTELLASLKAQRDALREEIQRRRGTPQRMTEEERQIAALNRQIAAVEERLRTGNFDTARRSTVDTELVAQVRERLREIRETYRMARQSDNRVIQQQLEASLRVADNTIAELDRRLQAGDTSTRAPKATPVSPELERKRAEIKAMQQLMARLRQESKPKATPEEVAIKSLKTRLSNENAKLKERMAREDFVKRERKPVDISRDREALSLRAENQKLRGEFNRAKELFERRNQTPWQKTKRISREIVDASRNIKTSIDFSAVLRQGGFIFAGNPLRGLRSVLPMFRAVNRSNYERLAQEIDLRENSQNGRYRTAGLFLTEMDGGNFSGREEQIRSEWADKIPGVRQSNQAFAAYINLLRADSFDAMVKSAERPGSTLTSDELKGIANYINIATGRGDLGKMAGAGNFLALILFSPRLLVSRFQLLLGQPFAKAGSNRIRRLIAQEYAKSLTGLGVMIGLGMLAGADVEDEPTSSDFGKLRFGNTRIDPLAGLSQTSVFMNRLARRELTTAGGERKSLEGYKWTQEINRFLRSKLAPIAGSLVDIGSGRDFRGEPVTLEGEAMEQVVPLSFSDIAATMEEQGVEKGAVISLLSLFGWGVQTYQAERPRP